MEISNGNELILLKRYNKNLMERQNKREREMKSRLENPFITENVENNNEIDEIINYLPSSVFKKDDKNNSKCMICLIW